VNKQCVTYSEGAFVAFVIQHAKRTRRVILPVATPDLSTFSTLFYKQHNLQKKKKKKKDKYSMEKKIIFSVFCARKISHSRKNAARYYYKDT